jgi:hypothetical protein
MTVNVLFGIDIGMNLFSVEDGMEDHCEIFFNYLTSWLIFDIVAIIPMNYIISNQKISGLNK